MVFVCRVFNFELGYSIYICSYSVLCCNDFNVNDVDIIWVFLFLDIFFLMKDK